MPSWLGLAMAVACCLLVPSLSQDEEDQPIPCEEAKLRCAYRTGCGRALQGYLVGCADLMGGREARCPQPCQRALIALTSTEEGHRLMRCDCQGDAFCAESKRRVEVCRPEVTRATHNSSVVSCSVAHLICAADPLCSTALDYYWHLCRHMFQGKKCTLRCNNSIEILRRQEKAARLGTCVCDGSEDFDCKQVRRNMERLCFPSRTTTPGTHQEETNEVEDAGPRGNEDKEDTRHSDGSVPAVGCWWAVPVLMLLLV